MLCQGCSLDHVCRLLARYHQFVNCSVPSSMVSALSHHPSALLDGMKYLLHECMRNPFENDGTSCNCFPLLLASHSSPIVNSSEVCSLLVCADSPSHRPDKIRQQDAIPWTCSELPHAQPNSSLWGVGGVVAGPRGCHTQQLS